MEQDFDVVKVEGYCHNALGINFWGSRGGVLVHLQCNG